MNLAKLSKNVRLLNARSGFRKAIWCFFSAMSFMGWNQVTAQSSLINDSFIHQVDFNGTYQDYVIPADIQANRIEFFLDGGDGGRNGQCDVKGGRGAWVSAVFPIGTGTNQLKPGSKIRFIIGGVGDSRTGSGNSGGSGGGGGTGILYLKSGVTTTEETPSPSFSDENSKWVILAVAGGGGGAWARDNCTEHKHGSGGNTGTNGTGGGGSNDGGTDGNGGETGSGFDGGSGGGYLTNGTPAYGINGRKGGITGGEGGHHPTDSEIVHGGYGYGGGGAGIDANNGGGGGGGGYSGGGGGNDGSGPNANNGGGGGSFVNSIAIGAFTDIDGNTELHDVQDGYATYIFRSQPNAVARCKDVTVTLIDGEYDLSVLELNNGSTVEPTEDIQSFGILTTIGPVTGPLPTRTFDCNDIGQKNLIVRLASTSGIISTCSSTVTIRDDVAPSTNCTSFTIVAETSPDHPYNLSVATVKNNPTNDACGIVVNEYLSQSVFTCDDLGPNTVTLYAVDNSGNIGSCTANVGVIPENIPPVLVCPGNITVSLGPEDGCIAAIGAPALAPVTLDRACGNELSYIFSVNPSSGLQTITLGSGALGAFNFPIGTANVNYRLTTNSTPLTCSFNITVTRTNPNPVAICQDATVTLNASGTGTLNVNQVNNGSSDQCGINSITLSKTEFTCADVGTQTVTMTVTNNLGNSSTCTANVTVVSSCACFPGTIVYVDQNATGAGTGEDWDNAFTTLGAATDFIANSGCNVINQIWVAQGTYYPDEGPGATDNDRGSSFSLLNDVGIYGGFNGTETMLSQRNWNLYPTILSGDLMQNDGPNFTGNNDNAYHIFNVVGTGITPSAVLDGFTLTAGYSNGISADALGGAMRIANGAAPTINNCKVVGNKSHTVGGGIVVNNAAATFSNCIIEGNFSQNHGGGVSLNSSSTSVFNDCIFRGNHVNIFGGGLYNISGSSVLLNNCVFSGNRSSEGSAIYTSNSGSTTTAINCSISGNRNVAVKANSDGANTLTNCIVWGNNEGIANESGGSANATNCIIQDGYSGATILNEDPLFVSQPNYADAPTTAGDLRLQSCSPAIDAGVDAANTTSTDLDGQNRKYDAVFGNAQIDMGAYEFQEDLDVDDDGYSSCEDDCDDNNALIHTPQLYYIDADEDGYGSTTTAMVCSLTAPSGFATNNTDCNDSDGAIHQRIRYYQDLDGDGYGSTVSALFCSLTAPSGYAANNTDCNDNDGAIHQERLYYRDVDGDGFTSGSAIYFCSSTPPPGYTATFIGTDCDDNNPSVHEYYLFYVDHDGDGFGSSTVALLCAISPPPGYSSNRQDCDDNNTAVNPNTVWYLDADNDNYYTGAGVTQCTSPGAGYKYAGLLGGNDCDDDDPSVHQLHEYLVDSDQDGYDSGLTAMLCSTTAPPGYLTVSLGPDCNDQNPAVHALQTFFVDNDGDGYGSMLQADLCALSPPTGYADNSLDCDDDNTAVNPNTVWYLDADNDNYYTGAGITQCNSPGAGYKFEGLLGGNDCNDNDISVYEPQLYYVDADNDGYGSTTTAMLCSSTAPSGYATNNTDCNDNDISVHEPQLYYVDADYDGYGSTTTAMLCSSTAPSGYSTNNTDCNDDDMTVHEPQLYYIDADYDGYGSTTTTMLCSSTAPSGYSTYNNDCNDDDDTVYPDAEEICDNKDNDCNYLIDDVTNSELANWHTIDVGGSNGSAAFPPCFQQPNEVFTVNANGFSTSSSDKLFAVYQELCGNGEIVARVLTVSGGGWAGIMLRETFDPGSRKVALKMQGNNNIRREIRMTANGAVSSLNYFRPQHIWLRLARNGSTFVGYTSIDGINWSYAFSATISMNGCIYAGLFSESINNSVTTTATFDNVTITKPDQSLSAVGTPFVASGNSLKPELQVEVFPNPTDGRLFLRFSEVFEQMASIRVYNTLGEQVLNKQTTTLDQATEGIDLSILADGVYTIRIDAGQVVVTKRIVLAKAIGLRP
mgnify:CR=1 FL=1